MYNEDHLNPDTHLWNHIPEEEQVMLGEIKESLRAACSGRWEWDRIDCCVTGKDADLEACGEQGIEAVSVEWNNGKYVAHLLAHVHKTIPGTDVSLAEDFEDDDEYQRKIEAYLAVAQEIVCSIPGSGDWSGDDWSVSDEIEFTVPVVFTDDESEVDGEKMVAAIMEAFDVAVADWDRECALADEALNRAAGY
jgi:hypothetical protein